MPFCLFYPKRMQSVHDFLTCRRLGTSQVLSSYRWMLKMGATPTISLQMSLGWRRATSR